MCIWLAIVPPSQDPGDQELAALGFIARHAERWRNIAFHLSLEEYAVLEATGLGKRLPNLLYLSTSEPFMYPGVPRSCVNLFSAAPQLREVELRGVYSPMLVLPLNHLTRLTVHGNNVADCFEILHRCPNAIYCAFHDVEVQRCFKTLHISQLDSILWKMTMWRSMQ